MHDHALTIEPLGEAELAPCSCCGRPGRRAWGFAHDAKRTLAGYFVEWTPGAEDDHEVCLDLVLGAWGDDTGPADRVAVSLALDGCADGARLVVVDAGDRPHVSLAAVALDARAVHGSAHEAEVRAVAEAVWRQDARVGALLAPLG